MLESFTHMRSCICSQYFQMLPGEQIDGIGFQESDDIHGAPQQDEDEELLNLVASIVVSNS
jgi:hypothetical protein